jgi:hypothetical protein
MAKCPKCSVDIFQTSGSRYEVRDFLIPDASCKVISCGSCKTILGIIPKKD